MDELRRRFPDKYRSARQFGDLDERIARIKGTLPSSLWLWYTAAGIAVLIIFLLLLWNWLSEQSKHAKNHPLLAKIGYQKLHAKSPTRLRLQRAGELFAEGWAALEALQDVEPIELRQAERSLGLFARAVEIDEMACGWKKHYEESLALVGDLFTDADADKDKPNGKETPKPSDESVYNSMMAEAYLVLVLYTVVALYSKPSSDVQEDYDVVKTRLDRCVRLKPQNPIPYKLRGDWCGRFSAQADRDACIRDFQKAIRLAEADPDGSNLGVSGVDPKELRSYLMAFCHFQLGCQLQHKQEYEGAAHHYEAAVLHADPDFVQLPDALFNLCILTVMKLQPDDNRSATLALAIQRYNAGCEAAKRLARWMPCTSYAASKKLAKQLLSKLSKAGFKRAQEKEKSAVEKKTD